ncbi:MAG: hypothetical protein ACR2LC_11520 [Pyrinomonadaceae bacterium]
MVKSGLVPSKISALGIEFSQANQNVLLNALAIITVYFLLAFIFYALSDFMNHRVATYVSSVKYQINKIEQLEKVIASLKEQTEKLNESTVEYKKVSSGLEKVNDGLKEVRNEMTDHIQELKKTIEKKESDKGEAKEVAYKAPEFKAKFHQLVAQNDKLIFESELINAQQEDIELMEMETATRNQDIVNNDMLVDRARLVAVLRILFDFIVPLGVASCAIYVLLRR